MRFVHPQLGTFEGTAEEVAEAVARLRDQGLLDAPPLEVSIRPAPPAPTGVALRDVPSNERLLYDFRHAGGITREARAQYVNVVLDFERAISPKNFLDVTQNDIRSYERARAEDCRHVQHRGTRGQTNGLALMRCTKGEYDWSPMKPEACRTSCPLWARKKTGTLGSMRALKAFYEYARERGLVTHNPAELTAAKSAKGQRRAIGAKKYKPTIGEVRELVQASRRILTPRDTGILLGLSKWGRRPSHTVMIHANEIVGVHQPDPEGVCFADFLGVKDRIELANVDGESKLRGYVISPIDKEHEDFLRNELMPYRLQTWGYAWNEGPLYPGDQQAKAYNATMIQEYVLDPLMTYLSKLGSTQDQARWREHLEPRSPKRISPGCFRTFFTTTLREYGVSREDRATLRGDRPSDAQEHYLDELHPREIVAKYRMPALLNS